jgi:hypothetical protein
MDQDPSTGRRRFLRLGLGTAPIVVSLFNRPALARSCLTVSAQVSMQADPMTSGAHGLNTCMGGSPNLWLTRESLKPLFGTSGGPKFLSIFGFLWGMRWTADTVFADVLAMSGIDDPQSFGGHLVAAYCNATKYPGAYPLSQGDVVALGQSIKHTGICQVPHSHQSWSLVELEMFLEQTYTLD